MRALLLSTQSSQQKKGSISRILSGQKKLPNCFILFSCMLRRQLKDYRSHPFSLSPRGRLSRYLKVVWKHLHPCERAEWASFAGQISGIALAVHCSYQKARTPPRMRLTEAYRFIRTEISRVEVTWRSSTSPLPQWASHANCEACHAAVLRLGPRLI